jgi:N-acetyl-gamma-glutamyl-phosphate reductase
MVGASGFAGEELVPLLFAHPHVDLVAATSRQSSGKALAQVFPRFSRHEKAKALKFSNANPKQLARDAEIIFLALPHGLAAEFAKPLLQDCARVFDLSADFRIHDAKLYKEFYGNDHPASDLLGGVVYGDPNWGRILCALGYSNAHVDEAIVDVGYAAPETVKFSLHFVVGVRQMRP